MRGLPGSGKSCKAKSLAGDHGIVCETDAYFVTQVGNDHNVFDFDSKLIPDAKFWNLNRFRDAVKNDCPVIVVDRGNSLSLDSKIFALYAQEFGYDVRLTEPDTPWWQEIRVLLKYKEYNRPILERWAWTLAEMNQQTHQVSAKTIFYWMGEWQYDLNVEKILSYVPSGFDPGRTLSRAPKEESSVALRLTAEEEENRVSGFADDSADAANWTVSKTKQEGEAGLISLDEFEVLDQRSHKRRFTRWNKTQIKDNDS